MATTKIGEFLTGLAQHLDVLRIGELIFILIILVRLYKTGKKQPDKERWITSMAMGSFLATLAPFALIQALSALGLRLFDADWARLGLTPLDIMFWVSLDLLFVMSGKKLFGIIDTTPPAEINGSAEGVDGVTAANGQSRVQ